MSCFVSLCNDFSVSDLCGLLSVKKICIYVINSVECVLYHDAYWSLNSLSENSSAVAISFFLIFKKKEFKTKQSITVKEFGFPSLFWFFFVFCMYIEL